MEKQPFSSDGFCDASRNGAQAKHGMRFAEFPNVGHRIAAVIIHPRGLMGRVHTVS
ncbi:hypothetical protein [Denitrobacterium detoxificans]|uniref:hypothetical protein n=1 Tax=Denitrobacterium detoxificans TaxID=79604 RepID=UPI0012E94461|nr:hypothetical protein [Denitrobacterium detoxificans]